MPPLETISNIPLRKQALMRTTISPFLVDDALRPYFIKLMKEWIYMQEYNLNEIQIKLKIRRGKN